MVCGKKRLSTREKFKGDLYWHTIDAIDTIQTHYNVSSFVSFLCCFCLHITEYEQIREGGAQNFLGPRGVKYLNTGLVAVLTVMSRAPVRLDTVSRTCSALWWCADRNVCHCRNTCPASKFVATLKCWVLGSLCCPWRQAGDPPTTDGSNSPSSKSGSIETMEVQCS